MVTLNEKSRKGIFESTGMNVEQIIDTDFDEIDAIIGKKIGHKITEYMTGDNFIGRGQVYAETGRFLYMDEVDKGLRKNDRRSLL